jgi:arsenate reductase
MTIRVLCLCTGNSARSIIAEALFREAGIEAESAGTDPKGVNPLTIAALAEIGIDARASARSMSTRSPAGGQAAQSLGATARGGRDFRRRAEGDHCEGQARSGV